MGILARFPGTSGDYASTPDDAAFSSLTDFSVLVRVSADDWTPAAAGAFAAHFATTGNQRAWIFRNNTAGNFVLVLSTSGSAATAYPSTAANTLTNGTMYWVLVTRASASGDIKFYTAADASSPPSIGSFTQLGTTVSGMTGTLFNSTSVLEVGTSTVGTSDLFDGDIRRVALYTGIYGSGSETLVRDFSPTDAGNTTDTSWAAVTTGETWTLNGGDVTLVGDTVTGTAAGASTASGSAVGVRTVLGAAAGAATSSGSATVAAAATGVTICDGDITLFVEVAFAAGSGFGAWDDGLWDTATWGPDITWTDVTDYVMHSNGINVDRAFSRDLQGWNPGTCSFVLNNTDGRFSPTNLSGPYVTGGVTEVRPWRPVRIRATHVATSTTYDVFNGYILSWGEVWTRGANFAQTTVSCVDELGSLARFDGYEQSTVGSGEVFGYRIHRILDNAAHAGNRNVDVGSNTFQPTTLAGNAVTELKLTADSEGGFLWVDADGTIIADGQESILSTTRSNTVQWTFSDAPTGSELPYRDVDLAYDGDQVENVVALARSGGSVQTESDLDSRALYGDKRYGRSDLICETDTQVSALAQLRIQRNAEPELRMTALHLMAPRTDVDLFPVILGVKPLERVAVKRTPPGGDAINRQVFIAGIHHRFDSTQWSVKFDTQSTTGYPAADDFGVWDTSLWDADYWSPV